MSKAEELVKATQEMPELESQATSVIRALVLLTNARERTLCPSEPSSWMGPPLGSSLEVFLRNRCQGGGRWPQ